MNKLVILLILLSGFVGVLKKPVRKPTSEQTLAELNRLYREQVRADQQREKAHVEALLKLASILARANPGGETEQPASADIKAIGGYVRGGYAYDSNGKCIGSAYQPEL